MLFDGIHHIAIICTNYEVSKKFYTELLGLAVIAEQYRSERQSYKLDLLVADNIQIELFSFPNAPSRPSYPEAAGLRHLAFSVSDIDSAVEKLKTAGVEVEEIRTDESTGRRYTFFSDPDQLPLELYESSK